MDLNDFYPIFWAMFLLAAGYYYPFIADQKLARVISWTTVVVSLVMMIKATSGQTPLFRMAVIVYLQLMAMKAVVMVETYPDRPRLKFWQWVAFASGWFGMRPALFEHLEAKPLGNVAGLVYKGISRIVLGFLLLYLSKWIEGSPFDRFFLSNLLLLAGLSFILHFGILQLSTAFWQLLGVPVKELFIAPYQSKSLREFWGQRWNLAFSEMTALVVYRPLKGLWGAQYAMIASFLLSGLLHEMAISLPVNAGYGLPLAYFALHGLAMYLENSSRLVKGIIQHPFASRVWVLMWLLLPMPILFHPAFIADVVIPLRALLLFF
jgi:hypothetical protein